MLLTSVSIHLSFWILCLFVLLCHWSVNVGLIKLYDFVSLVISESEKEKSLWLFYSVARVAVENLLYLLYWWVLVSWFHMFGFTWVSVFSLLYFNGVPFFLNIHGDSFVHLCALIMIWLLFSLFLSSSWLIITFSSQIVIKRRVRVSSLEELLSIISSIKYI